MKNARGPKPGIARFFGVLLLAALIIGVALAAQLVIPAAATHRVVERGKTGLENAQAQKMDETRADLDSTELTQGFVLEVVDGLMEHDQAQLDRSMRAVEHVAVSADVAQTTTSLTSVCWPAAIVAACVTVIFFAVQKREGDD